MGTAGLTSRPCRIDRQHRQRCLRRSHDEGQGYVEEKGEPRAEVLDWTRLAVTWRVCWQDLFAFICPRHARAQIKSQFSPIERQSASEAVAHIFSTLRRGQGKTIMVSFQCVLQQTSSCAAFPAYSESSATGATVGHDSYPRLSRRSTLPQVAGMSLQNQSLINIGLRATHRLTVSTAANASKPRQTTKSTPRAYQRPRNTRKQYTTVE